jgi:hypothetical protein
LWEELTLRGHLTQSLRQAFLRVPLPMPSVSSASVRVVLKYCKMGVEGRWLMVEG